MVSLHPDQEPHHSFNQYVESQKPKNENKIVSSAEIQVQEEGRKMIRREDVILRMQKNDEHEILDVTIGKSRNGI